MDFCYLKVTLYFFLLFNHVLFILGGLILSCGLWILTNQSPIGTILHMAAPPIKLGVWVCVAVGAVTMMAGLMGCAGVYYGIRLLLGIYVATLLMILAAQVATGIYIFLRREEVAKGTAETIRNILLTYDPDDQANRTTEIAWDYVQYQYNCCGWTGPKNWLINAALQKRNYTAYPCTCRRARLVPLGFCPSKLTPETWPVKERGCQEGLLRWVVENLGIILGFCVAVALSELLGLVLSLCLYKSKRRVR